MSQNMSEKALQDSPGVNIMPPKVLSICLVLGLGLEFIFPQEFPFAPVWARIILGIIVTALGFVFMMSAHEKFIKQGTNVKTNQPALKLVDFGAYSLSRNPMYVGMLGMFLGLAIGAGSLWMILTFGIMFVYLQCYVIPKEESYMQRRYGNEYLSYCTQVRRWI